MLATGNGHHPKGSLHVSMWLNKKEVASGPDIPSVWEAEPYSIQAPVMVPQRYAYESPEAEENAAALARGDFANVTKAYSG